MSNSCVLREEPHPNFVTCLRVCSWTVHCTGPSASGSYPQPNQLAWSGYDQGWIKSCLPLWNHTGKNSTLVGKNINLNFLWARTLSIPSSYILTFFVLATNKIKVLWNSTFGHICSDSFGQNSLWVWLYIHSRIYYLKFRIEFLHINISTSLFPFPSNARTETKLCRQIKATALTYV